MTFYQRQHPFYCGVDLHAKTMHVCILDQAGKVLVHRNLPARRDYFLNALTPYRRRGIVVGVECMFAWYWLADLCDEHQIPFVLGHALYMKAIHGGKTKALSILAAKLGRAVYWMLKRREAFDVRKLFGGQLGGPAPQTPRDLPPSCRSRSAQKERGARGASTPVSAPGSALALGSHRCPNRQEREHPLERTHGVERDCPWPEPTPNRDRHQPQTRRFERTAAGERTNFYPRVAQRGTPVPRDARLAAKAANR